MLDQGTCQAIGLEDLFEIKESMMINKTRSGLFIFHAACLILAVLCFYFSISEALFMWFYPDELGPMNVLNGGTGIIGCTGSYYLHTSVNRLSADFGLCLMARTTEVFSSHILVGYSLDYVFMVLFPYLSHFYLIEFLASSLNVV